MNNRDMVDIATRLQQLEANLRYLRGLVAGKLRDIAYRADCPIPIRDALLDLAHEVAREVVRGAA
jgi:hypothetical protein